MSAESEVLEQLRSELIQGEQILAVAAVQVKGGQKKSLAKTGVATAAASVLLGAATGGAFGMVVAFTPPPGFLIATTERLTVIARNKRGKSGRQTLFVAPRLAVSAQLKTGLLSEVTIIDRSDNQSVMRLNLGVRRGSARDIVAAVEHGVAP